MKILHHVSYFLCESRELGCLFSLQIKCHAVLRKGSLLRRRLSWSKGKVRHAIIASAVFWPYIRSLGAIQVNPRLSLKACSYPRLLKNTAVRCIKL